MPEALNADFRQRAVAETATMDWQQSPSPTVWRKRLDLAPGPGGSEQSRVTSVVRYDPGAAFPSHDHPMGEEILVLEGVFSDESGDFPAGSYMLNPEGFAHAPFSKEGCVILVKLRQYPDTKRVIRDTDAMDWLPMPPEGITAKPLYGSDDFPERMSLIRFAPGARSPDHAHPAGEEIFVVEGSLEDEHGRYPTGTWLRQPPGSRHAPWSDEGCVLYVKSGHLGELRKA